MPNETGPAKVREIQISNILPNPHNPRRLFDEEPMQILKESIRKLGILVPVTVYQSRYSGGESSDQYTLLDGERRWRCAKELHLMTIPAIVVEEPDDTQNILTMFHIHNVREGWQLMPTAIKLKTLIRKLSTDNERKLAELTKLSISQVRRCKILLSYSKKFQNMMLAPPDKRLRADFFIELDRIRRPAVEERFPPWVVTRTDDKCIEILLEKYLSGYIKAVTDFRKLTEVYRASVAMDKKRQFMEQLDDFLTNLETSIEDVKVEGATFAREAKEMRRSANRLYTQISNIDLEVVAYDSETIDSLKRLISLIQQKLKDALLIEAREEANN